jgi:uncharacterized phage protein gp47/JayE
MNDVSMQESTSEQNRVDFNAAVDAAVIRVYDNNKAMLDDDTSLTVIALANALTAADMTVAMAVQTGNGEEFVKTLLSNLFNDMQARAMMGLQYYKETTNA